MATFSNEAIRLAQQSQVKYGVPASVTLAQYALESGYGTSTLATKANNYFGVTGSYNGNSIMLSGRQWRSYDSMEQSFDDHGRLLSSGRYATATQNAKSAGQYVDAIAEIYAPSSDGNTNYAGTLKQIIQDNNLTQYDVTNVDGATSYLQNSMSANYSLLDDDGMQIGTTGVGYIKDKATEILAKVIKILAYVFLAVMAIIFFMNAMEISPKKMITKAALKKTGIDDVLEDVVE